MIWQKPNIARVAISRIAILEKLQIYPNITDFEGRSILQISLQYMHFLKFGFITDNNPSYPHMRKFSYIPYIDFILYARYALDTFPLMQLAIMNFLFSTVQKPNYFKFKGG